MVAIFAIVAVSVCLLIWQTFKRRTAECEREAAIAHYELELDRAISPIIRSLLNGEVKSGELDHDAVYPFICVLQTSSKSIDMETLTAAIEADQLKSTKDAKEEIVEEQETIRPFEGQFDKAFTAFCVLIFLENLPLLRKELKRLAIKKMVRERTMEYRKAIAEAQDLIQGSLGYFYLRSPHSNECMSDSSMLVRAS